MFYYCKYIQVKKLQAHILQVAKDEPYMGEGIPLRWLKFEKAKAATKEGMMKMSQVIFFFGSQQK